VLKILIFEGIVYVCLEHMVKKFGHASLKIGGLLSRMNPFDVNFFFLDK
jgi:hypothetical protein